MDRKVCTCSHRAPASWKKKLAGVFLLPRYVVCCVGAEFFCQKTSDASFGCVQLLQSISAVGTKTVSLPSPLHEAIFQLLRAHVEVSEVGGLGLRLGGGSL